MNTPLTGPVRYRVVHETQYSYQSLVTLSQQVLHLTPRSFVFQRTESQQLSVQPGAEHSSDGFDYFGNHTRHITITEPHKQLLVRADSTVALSPRPQLGQIHTSQTWESLAQQLQHVRQPAILEASRYLYDSPHIQCGAELARYARSSYSPGRPHLDAALALTQRIFDEFEFDDQATEISTPLSEVLKGRRGVCQDFAQLMIGCLRSLGLPARYVSGYILTQPPPGQPRLIGADASHAWVSVFCPRLGWIDFDPTNRCLVQAEHISLGWGRDFSDVTPLRGVVLGGGGQELSVSVTVIPASEELALA
ncbi:MAG: transglutaminase family protein [Pseudomonas sp.]|nr:transglutaminase family protein [Pseudomonas sp.]